MSDSCRICSQPGTHKMGAYLFCDVHYHRVQRKRSGVWQADVASIMLLIVFILLIIGLEQWLQPVFSPASLLAAGVIMAVVPAIIWLAFFYRRDRMEPEPKGLVLQMYLMGGLLAAAVGIPLVEELFGVSSWLSGSPVWAQLLGGLLIVGMTHEFLKYAAVRFSVYNSQEFDECSDGVVYMTAVGLGYATVLNINFVAASGGVALGSGAIRIVLTTLAHAAFAGVTGYFLGRQKFEERPLWWMPAGVLSAAALNSLFFFFRGMLSQGSLSDYGGMARPWIGLALAVVLTAVVTLFLSRAIHRDIQALLAAEEGSS